MGTGLAYKGFTYSTIQLRLSADNDLVDTCWDTGCTASLIDRDWLLKQLPNQHIHLMSLPLKVQGISGNMHTTSEYVILDLRIPGKDLETNEPVQAVVTKEFHIVEGLRANVLK